LQLGNTIQYQLPAQGELDSYHSTDLASLGMELGIASRVGFYQCDPCNLDIKYTDYDVVVCANVLEQLYDPVKLLTTIHTRIKTGGLLFLASTYNWLETITPKSNWLGGFKQNGENVDTLDTIDKLLSPNFLMLQKPIDIAWSKRITLRTFHYAISQLTVWIRRA